jgi:ABC-type dipeptide/oligopeptide/nickel transport system permease subunit
MEKKQNFFRKNLSFTIFAVLAILLILMAVFAPAVCGDRDPLAGDLAQAIQSPSAEHPFGTDKMGRDIFARVIYGARASLSSTFILVAVVFVIGTVLGILAGYFGGAVDAVIMRFADMMIAFPGLVLAIAVAGILGASTRNAVIAITIVTWPKYARLARSLVMKIRHTDFVAAATVTGSKTGYMLRKYMLPNTITTLVITAATDIGGLMMELAALSFLGFGAQPPIPEWGAMISDARNYMRANPMLAVYPGLCVIITVLAFNLLGDGLRDALDPRLKN